MICPSCKSVLTSKVCGCGYAVRVAPPQKQYSSSPQREVQRAFTEKLKIVNDHVRQYKAKNQGATTREACLAFLKKKGLLGALPETVKREVRRTAYNDTEFERDQREAQAERKAIQEAS